MSQQSVLSLGEVSSAELRVVQAATRCIGRWGLAKTTLDDVAREAGVSRATVYRLFPGGKSALVEACGGHEIGRLLVTLDSELQTASTAADVLVRAMCGAARFVAENDALSMLVTHEPDVLRPFLAFDRVQPILTAARAFVAPHLARHLPTHRAEQVAEWATRLVISFTFTPDRSIDLTDLDQAVSFVESFILPGLDRDVLPSSG